MDRLTDTERQTIRRHLLGVAHVLTTAIERQPSAELYRQRLIILDMLRGIEDYDQRYIEIVAAVVVQ